MATRLRFNQSSAGPTAPAYASLWNDTTASPLSRLMTKWQTGTFQSFTTTMTETSTANDWDVYMGTAVTPPLRNDVTISGTIIGLINGRETATSANLGPQGVIRVFSGDLTTERGVLFAGNTATSMNASVNEFSTSASNYTQWFPYVATVPGTPTAITSVDALAGDRLVIEIGFRATNTSATTTTCTIAFMCSTGMATGHQENNAGWLEFSADFEFEDTLLGTSSHDFDMSGTLTLESGFELIASTVDLDVALGGTLTITTINFVALEASLDMEVSLDGFLIKLLAILGEMDLSVELESSLRRGWPASMVASNPALITLNATTGVPAPSTVLVLEPLTISLDSAATLRKKVATIYTPPVPESVSTTDPSQATGNVVRALMGVAAVMDTPAITDGKPSS